MVDDKEVDLEEKKIQKTEEGINRTQNHTYSSCNKTSPQWKTNANTYRNNSMNSNNVATKAPYLELQKNVEDRNHINVQEQLTGGKLANYNRSSGMIDDLSMDPYPLDSSSNEINANGKQPNSTRFHLNKQLEGIFIIIICVINCFPFYKILHER